tara:strand:- start:788 stop:1096 length:309 start_codon:yes stop_codon:yes gene_type:complete
MKEFDTEHNKTYYKDWVYLGTISKKDYYLQSLPSKKIPSPSTSIVYGKDPSEYISATVAVSDILDDNNVWHIMLHLLQNPSTSMYIHLIAFIREYSHKVNTH